jgi:hypothetical protein
MNRKELTHILDLFNEYDLYGYKSIPIVEKAFEFVDDSSTTTYFKRSFAFFALGYEARKKEEKQQER